jgi:hypothetical protein
MYAAAMVPDGEPADGRPVRTSLRRGPWAVVLTCGACGNWLAVGHRPGDPDVTGILLACPACHRVNDPQRAAPSGHGGAGEAVDPPGELSRSEVWAKAVVERVHALAAQERRWPWRADAG